MYRIGFRAMRWSARRISDHLQVTVQIAGISIGSLSAGVGAGDA